MLGLDQIGDREFEVDLVLATVPEKTNHSSHR